MNDLRRQLERPFESNQVKWYKGPGGKQLAYVDARAVMRRFDDVCGVENWQCRYPFEGCCEIGIKIGDEWVWKSNGAGETSIEPEKGQYSDAFKRAAVVWGVARYLYSIKGGSLPSWATPEGFDKLVEEGKI